MVRILKLSKTMSLCIAIGLWLSGCNSTYANEIRNRSGEIQCQIYHYSPTHVDPDLAEISKANFKDSFKISNQNNYGIQEDGIHYFKIVFNKKMKDQEKVMIEIQWPSLDSIWLYERTTKSYNFLHIRGDNYPFTQKPFKNNFFVFSHLINYKSANTLLLKIRSNGEIRVPISVKTELHYFESKENENFYTGLIFGILSFTCLLNLIMFFSTNSKSSLMFSLSVFGFILYLMSIKGYGFKFIWPNQIYFQQVVDILFLSLIIPLELHFSRLFLKTRRYFPKLDRLLKHIVFLSILLILASSYNHNFIRIIVFFCWLLIGLLIIVVAIKGLKMRIATARFFLISRLIYFSGGIYLFLQTFPWFGIDLNPSDFLPFTYIFHTLVLTMALGDRIRILREETNENLGLVAKYTDEFVLIVHKENIIEWGNKSFNKITGRSNESSKGENWMNFLMNDTNNLSTKTALLNAQFEQKSFKGTILFHHNIKGQRRLSFNSSPILDKKGNVLRYIIIGRDTTAEYETLLKLKISENNYSELTNSMKEVFWLFNLTQNKFEFANLAYENVFGNSLEDLKQNPKSWLVNIHPDDVKKVQYQKEITQIKGNFTGEFRVLTPCGSIKWVSIRSTLVKSKEQSDDIKIAGFLLDITEKKESELLLEQKSKDINDSINYSSSIQKRLLPSLEDIQKYMNKVDIFFQPKEKVSGDFFWAEPNPNDSQEVFCAVADCTGHGVPGAFISIIAFHYIVHICRNQKIDEPQKILTELNNKFLKAFNNDKFEYQMKDGMDLSFCKYNKLSRKLTYCGAKSNAYVLRENTLIPLLRSKKSIGDTNDNVQFIEIEQTLEIGDRVILMTDGFVDQFGGLNNKKFKIGKLRELLIQTNDLELHEQMELMKIEFNDWKGNTEQIDDVTLLIFEV